MHISGSYPINLTKSVIIYVPCVLAISMKCYQVLHALDKLDSYVAIFKLLQNSSLVHQGRKIRYACVQNFCNYICMYL